MKCLNCNKELELVTGKKPKQYCNDSCRIAFKRKSEQRINNVVSNPNKSEQTGANPNIPENSAAYTPQGCTQSQETISDIPLNSGDILPLDLTIHDFNYDVNKYQSYVINRNKQTRDCIAATPLDVLKQSDQFIPAWRYAIG